LRETSLALAEKVFIRAEKARKLRDVPRSVKYSRETRLALSTLFCVVGFSLLSASEYSAAPKGEDVSAGAVIGEMNLARQNPALYATHIEELRSRFDGISVVLPGEPKWRMKEGLARLKRLCASFAPFVRNNRSRCRRECVVRQPIIAPIRLPGVRDIAAATAAVRAIVSLATESGPGCWAKTLRTEKRPRERSSLRSLLTMVARREHTVKTFSIPVSITLA
jgi:hypothetical protein